MSSDLSKSELCNFDDSGTDQMDANNVTIGTYKDLAKDHKNIFLQIHAGKIYHITAEHEGLIYRIFNLSEYDDKVDSSKKFLTVSGRSMQDAALFFLSCSRDFLINIRIMSTKGKSYFVEPRLEAISYNAKKMGLKNRKKLADLILNGSLGDVLTSDTASLRSRQKSVVKKSRLHDSISKFQEIENLETELANIRAREMAILSRLNRTSSITQKLKDERIRWQDGRISELRQFIISNELKVPAPVAPQGKKNMLKSS